MAEANRRGYEVEQNDGLLRISFERDLMNLDETQNWAEHLIRSLHGPFHTIEIDIGKLPVLASTTIGALIQIWDHFKRQGSEKAILLGCSDRVRRTLEMMRIDSMFSFG